MLPPQRPLSGTARLATGCGHLSIRVPSVAEAVGAAPTIPFLGSAISNRVRPPDYPRRLRKSLEEAAGIEPTTRFRAPAFRAGRQAICHRFLMAEGGGLDPHTRLPECHPLSRRRWTPVHFALRGASPRFRPGLPAL